MFDIENHLINVANSLKKLTGIQLLPHAHPSSLKDFFDSQDYVLVSHGIETDPVLNYGNLTALNLWKMKWEDFTKTESRKTAEAPLREERQALLNRVSKFGFIDDYSGIRIDSKGNRFKIEKAIVWTVYNEKNAISGQAATFNHWEFI